MIFSKITIIEPQTPKEFEAYYLLRYEVLRKPWKQPFGSEKDDMESYLKEQSELVLTSVKEEEVIEVKKEEVEVKKEVKIEELIEEEEEISYVRKKIKGTYYFVSDEKPPQIYQYLENNEVGSLVGKMNDKKAEFF